MEDEVSGGSGSTRGWLRRAQAEARAPRALDVRHAPCRPQGVPARSSAPPLRELELIIRPDGFLWDGRFANNAWLQELPRPFTSPAWSNALWVGPEFARCEGLEPGDLIRLSTDAGSVEAPVVVVPGMADGCAQAELGGGRTAAGAAGNGRGFNAFALLPGAGESSLEPPGSAGRKRAGAYPLVLDPASLRDERTRSRAGEDRGGGNTRAAPLADPATSALSRAPGAFACVGEALIDLTSCLGCSACVAACQAENNIPSVGKDAVSRGREMHWIRIDRYYGPDDRALVLWSPVCTARTLPARR